MLFKLLSLPVTGPIRAIEQVAHKALREMHDPAKILAEFEALRDQLDRGDVTDEDYKARSAALNARFAEARALHSTGPNDYGA